MNDSDIFNTTRVLVHLPNELFTQLKANALFHGVSVGEHIVTILRNVTDDSKGTREALQEMIEGRS